ncbi:hypothetical protein ACFWHN_36575, partial [Streptomyces yangpuensis]
PAPSRSNTLAAGGGPAPAPSSAPRPPPPRLWGGGDSDTDISFLRDATALRLVVNRNKNELMCRAYDNSDGKWIVNPMFIEPKKQRTSPYPCSTTGYVDHDGTAGPVRRGDSTVIPDQTDTVH